MPRLNLYEMANPFRAPRSSGADFGAAPALAMEGFGDEALKIGERIQKREENAISDQVFGEVNTQALPLLTDFEKKHDIALPQALNEFQGAMQKIKADALSKATLRPEARAALERQLDNQIVQYGKSAIGMRIKAGNDAMLARLNEQFSTGVNQVGAAPSAMQDVIDTNVRFVESRKDSMDPLMYQAAMKKAQAGPIQAAVQAYAAQGLWDQADSLIKDPKINAIMEPDALRPLRIDIAVGRGKQEKEEREIESNRKALSYLLGAEVTREQALTVPGLANMPVVQKLNVMRMMNGGRELPQETVNRVLGIERQNNESLTNELLDEAANYRNMTPQEQFIHRQKAAKVYGLTRRVDDKGYTSTFSNIPGELLNLYGMDERGNLTGGAGAGGITDSIAGGGKSEVRTMLEQEGFPIDERGEFVPGGQKGQSGPGGQRTRSDVEPARIPPTRNSADLTVDEMLYDVAGVFSAIGEYAARTPGIGTVAKDSQRVVDYKARVTSAGNNIVSLLQKNDKYPEGERTMIANEVAKVIRVWDNPESAARNLRSIELGLQDRQKAAEEIRDDVNLNKDTRDSARIMATQIKNYRKQLGVLQPKDEKEIKQLVDDGELYPGRNFWTPEGKRKKFTQEAYDEIMGGKKK